jgi:hypothetical protein
VATAHSAYSLVGPAPALLYTRPGQARLTPQSLHPDGRLFLGGSREAPLLVELATGATLATLPLHSALPLAQLGFLNHTTVFMLHSPHVLVLADLAGTALTTLDYLPPWTPPWTPFHQLVSTTRLLLWPSGPSGLGTPPRLSALRTPGRPGAPPGCLGWAAPRFQWEAGLVADPASLVGRVTNHSEEAVVILNFV